MKHKSVREVSGVDIIKGLTGQDSTVLIDPTLVLSREEWFSLLNLEKSKKGNYLLAYFLDSPSLKAKKAIKYISEKYGLEVVSLPYVSNDECLSNVKSAGPREFVEYIKNATFVCTDSFHGTAFSINFNIPFFAFERMYGNAGNQSARIESILKMTGHINRYEAEKLDSCMEISFEKSNEILELERRKSKDYLASALKERI
ncbi:MAG: polysaccharide pyruvyl transferase family protein [Clostridia bacterium]|nr:polysaccharide pyruvyl transferase family protein [Clostridia bacterium]